MNDFVIRRIKTSEIDEVAAFISAGYYDDIFFHWVVDSDEDRLQVVTNYYKVYLRA